MPSLFVTVNASINAVVSVFSIIGNTIIIMTFARTKSIQNATNMFLVQLSLSDLTKATLILPVKVYNQYKDVKTFENSYCQVSGVVTTSTTILAVSYLATIAVVRYFKILKWGMFQRAFSFRRRILYSGFIISTVFALAMLPVLGVGQYSYSKYHGACFANWDSHNILFRSIFYVFNIGISFPVLVFCYWKIFRFLRKHKKKLTSSKAEVAVVRMVKKASSKRHQFEDKRTATSSFDVCISEKPINSPGESLPEAPTSNHCDVEIKTANEGDQGQSVQIVQKKEDVFFEAGSANQQKLEVLKEASNEVSEAVTSNDSELEIDGRAMKLTRKDINVTWILFMGVISYVVCWFPATITTVLSLSKLTRPTDVQLYAIVTMVELKLLLNPLIYGVLNTQFRQAAKALFCHNC